MKILLSNVDIANTFGQNNIFDLLLKFLTFCSPFVFEFLLTKANNQVTEKLNFYENLSYTYTVMTWHDTALVVMT